MDPDQDRYSAGPDLGPNSLQRLLAGEQKLPLERKEFGSRSGQTFCSSVGPDLGPNSLQRLSAEDKSCRRKGKRLDPDHDRYSVGPDLGPKGYPQEDKICHWKGKCLFV